MLLNLIMEMCSNDQLIDSQERSMGFLWNGRIRPSSGRLCYQALKNRNDFMLLNLIMERNEVSEYSFSGEFGYLPNLSEFGKNAKIVEAYMQGIKHETG